MRLTLLDNAVQSIRTGVADYQVGTADRLLSAVRSIHSGILLLYKEALRRLCPPGSDEVLLKARVLPRKNSSGTIVFVGVGRKTVDVQQIKERFEGLAISTDWKRFDRISDVRNDIEHYYPETTQKALEGVIADACLVIRSFVTNELRSEPLELLGDETWRAMVAIAEIHEAERKECRAALEGIEWNSDALSDGVQQLPCGACGSDLLMPLEKRPYDEVVLRCRVCGAQEPAEGFVERVIDRTFEFERYLVGTDGGSIPHVSCPECNRDTYVLDERRCAYCGHEAEHECQICGNEIPAEELDSSPYCGWCDHMMHKDD